MHIIIVQGEFFILMCDFSFLLRIFLSHNSIVVGVLTLGTQPKANESMDFYNRFKMLLH